MINPATLCVGSLPVLASTFDDPAPLMVTTRRQDRMAALTLAAAARDAAELREWLAMLDLTPARCGR